MRSVFLLSATLLMTVNTLAGTGAFNERFRMSAGSSINTFDSDLQLNSKTRKNNASISLEDDLKYNEDVSINFGRLYWRVADKHRISVEHLPLKRSTNARIDEDIDFEDDTILAGATIDSDFDTYITDINYIYSVYKSPKLEVGISGGIYWMDLDFSIGANGFIENSSGEVEFDEDYNNSADFGAPVPLLGVYVDYALTQNWFVGGGARYFTIPTVEFGGTEYDGQIISLEIYTEYYVLKHLGLGTAVGYFDLSASAEGGSFRGDVDWGYSGIQAFVALKY